MADAAPARFQWSARLDFGSEYESTSSSRFRAAVLLRSNIGVIAGDKEVRSFKVLQEEEAEHAVSAVPGSLQNGDNFLAPVSGSYGLG